jgi:hypothetical protein
MKKTLIAFSILVASVAHAGEITQEQLNQVLQQNLKTYMNVSEGMTAEYQEAIQHEDDDNCIYRRKEVVVGVQESKYLVYVKETNMSDCYDSKKGEVKEYLLWNDIVKPQFLGDNVRMNNISLEGNIASINYTLFYNAFNVYEIGYKIDVTQSQFYGMIESSTEGEFKEEILVDTGREAEITKSISETKLLRRSQTDIKTINIENLEVMDF